MLKSGALFGHTNKKKYASRNAAGAGAVEDKSFSSYCCFVVCSTLAEER